MSFSFQRFNFESGRVSSIPHHIADMRLHFLVNAHKNSCCAPPPVRKGMRYLARHLDHDRLLHAVSEHFSTIPSRRPCTCSTLGCCFPGLRFPPMYSFLRCRGARALARMVIHSRNVFAQPAKSFQALGLGHVQLKLQLEQVVREIPPWCWQLVVR